nr:G-protein coupled receptor 143 isoform X3 [Misgurnus anguillicaudatus]
MASPRLETFCCPNRDPATELVVSFQSRIFSSICICSSGLSLIFCVLQMLPKRRDSRRLSPHPHPKPTASSRILFIISLCDVLGCAGIIVRSSIWVGLPNVVNNISVNSSDVWPQVYCVGSAQMWIQLFFSASFWWSFCYAVDVYLVVKRSAGISTMVLYHMITWGLTLLLCVEGVAMLYYPSISSWLPNIINESLLFYMEMQPDIKAIDLKNIRNAALITWFIMGILNPMQGFLNSLAFHGWMGLDVDLSHQRRRDLPWDSASTSVAVASGYNPVMGSTLFFQSHVQKNLSTNGHQQHSDAISVLSEGSESSTVEIHISSDQREFEDVNPDHVTSLEISTG